jgi:ABC-type glycerol-3-phosphate transport system substrate-binding protein
MIRRALASVAAIAALGLSLAACTEAKKPPAPADGADSGGRVILWARATLQVQATLLVDAYNATHTNQVELTLVPAADLPARIDTAAGRGALPDLLAGGVADVPGWTGRGLYQDITGRIDRLAFAGQLDARSVQAGTRDGAKHAVPFVVDPAGGDGIGISRDSKKADQAWNFLFWLLSDEAQVQVLARNGDRVARADLAANEFSATATATATATPSPAAASPSGR